MELQARNLIGAASVQGEGEAFTAFDTGRGEERTPQYRSATSELLEQACAGAHQAARVFADSDRALRARLLETIAANLGNMEDAIVVHATSETGLPEARIRGELARTISQLRLFSGVLTDGAYLDIRVDDALPDRAPPRPDLRVINRPLGPVAVFGASNFPLAFSVAGGDTASALAAGCPVVVKAHPAHPATSELAGRAIQQAVAECGLPGGVFSLLFEAGIEIGQALVADERIRAVGFTGSRKGGLALMQIAQSRTEPIPVYAEMSAINPVVLMPGALAERGADIGQAFAAAQTNGAGQFCTNPGLVVALEGEGVTRFIEGVAQAYAAMEPAPMLTRGIHAAYCEGLSRMADHAGVRIAAQAPEGAQFTSRPTLLQTNAETFLGDDALSHELFGAASLLVMCRNEAELHRVLHSLEGQLTGAVHVADSDLDAARAVARILEETTGRVIFNGFGTGVEVADAIIHGGPFPATSDGRTTSVGSLAIARFLRPICYQGVPQSLLPADLQDAALARLPHRRNGKMLLPE
ncbi:aldehyde dehydrogenase (NADP(+)) [Paraurantiacibacter namhicola]|uniref:Alpha-ketoglutaric semialdehyde dehydrogenase n=1 Tax=Paraurantiacibacter namhicola TaxID=645517 RepID=A0A1C7D7A6_9SPHN|nr:aldehyde dehydrogenase (NADP(+)) [Paraurantiacibacter namhicola]ANU07328.1 Alpha-ketoglutaric semialdehyde dehydrogenase [Paraurantiacibacter namhicola]